jgi:hypothetical protein
MKLDIQSIGKAFAPGIMFRAIRAFDRATMVVVLTCWTGALFVMIFALYTLNLSVTAKHDMWEAAAAEPSLPRIVSKVPEAVEVQPFVDRLKKQFPSITFAMGHDQAVTVSTTDIDNFRLWLTVLSYIDTALPQYRWTVNEFCVGIGCDRSTPMQATLKAEKITFATANAEKN